MPRRKSVPLKSGGNLRGGRRRAEKNFGESMETRWPGGADRSS